MQTNKDVYSTVEFDTWAHGGEGLKPEEKLLVERYLDKNAATLEGGTAGGRILHALRGLGFTNLHGFDYVPEYIEAAKRRDPSGVIAFKVQDATRLDYADNSFDQVLYFGQMICFIESEDGRKSAVREAYRILRPGKTAVFTFLPVEARSGMGHRGFLAYLSVLRALTRSRRSIQSVPWLLLGGKFNWAALRDAGPYLYWYHAEEAESLLKSGGFKVLAAGSRKQMLHCRILENCSQVAADGVTGMLYVVCSK